MKRIVRQIISFSILLGMLLAPLASRADDSGPSEYQVKAAFLFNFTKFVKWPETAFPDTNSPVVIGINGENPFGPALAAAVKDKTINGRPLIVRPVSSLAEMKLCQVVFISPKPKRNLADTITALNNASVLTVSETGRFIELGGMINFYIEGTKVHFEINDAAAAKAGLTISSRLLSVAMKKERPE